MNLLSRATEYAAGEGIAYLDGRFNISGRIVAAGGDAFESAIDAARSDRAREQLGVGIWRPLNQFIDGGAYLYSEANRSTGLWMDRYLGPEEVIAAQVDQGNVLGLIQTAYTNWRMRGIKETMDVEGFAGLAHLVVDGIQGDAISGSEERDMVQIASIVSALGEEGRNRFVAAVLRDDDWDAAIRMDIFHGDYSGDAVETIARHELSGPELEDFLIAWNGFEEERDASPSALAERALYGAASTFDFSDGWSLLAFPALLVLGEFAAPVAEAFLYEMARETAGGLRDSLMALVLSESGDDRAMAAQGVGAGLAGLGQLLIPLGITRFTRGGRVGGEGPVLRGRGRVLGEGTVLERTGRLGEAIRTLMSETRGRFRPEDIEAVRGIIRDAQALDRALGGTGDFARLPIVLRNFVSVLGEAARDLVIGERVRVDMPGARPNAGANAEAATGARASVRPTEGLAGTAESERLDASEGASPLSAEEAPPQLSTFSDSTMRAIVERVQFAYELAREVRHQFILGARRAVMGESRLPVSNSPAPRNPEAPPQAEMAGAGGNGGGGNVTQSGGLPRLKEVATGFLQAVSRNERFFSDLADPAQQEAIRRIIHERNLMSGDPYLVIDVNFQVSMLELLQTLEASADDSYLPTEAVLRIFGFSRMPADALIEYFQAKMLEYEYRVATHNAREALRAFWEGDTVNAITRLFRVFKSRLDFERLLSEILFPQSGSNEPPVLSVPPVP